MNTKQMKEELLRLKEKYDKARVNYEIAKNQRENIIKEMEKYNVTPKNIDKVTEKLEKEAEELKIKIENMIGDINEKLNTIK